jgi:hypothetical protein
LIKIPKIPVEKTSTSPQKLFDDNQMSRLLQEIKQKNALLEKSY